MQNTSPEITANNSVRLLLDGHETFSVIKEVLSRAQRCINLEYFLISDDTTGRRIRDILCERSRVGVKVRVIIDAAGSWRLGRNFIDSLRDAGVQVQKFMPLTLRNIGVMIHRDHRKIITADKTTEYFYYTYTAPSTGLYALSVEGSRENMEIMEHGALNWSAFTSNQLSDLFMSEGDTLNLRVSGESGIFNLKMTKTASVEDITFSAPKAEATATHDSLEIEVNAVVPLDASFTLVVQYGLNTDEEAATEKNVGTYNATDPRVTASVSIDDLLPGTDYYYRVILKDDAGNEYYGDWTKQTSKDISATPLKADDDPVTKEVTDTTTDANEIFTSFTAKEDGYYVLTVSGPDCDVSTYQEGDTSWNHVEYNGSYTIKRYFKAGETITLRVQPSEAGTYSVAAEDASVSVQKSGSNLEVTFYPTITGLSYCAVYSEAGQMLACDMKQVEAKDSVIFTLPASNAALVKVFVVDSETSQPIMNAKSEPVD